MTGFPLVRPRRLRVSEPMRRLVAETRVHPAELVLPVFVKEGAREPQPIASMPGVVQHTRESLRKAASEAAALGVGGIMVFGIPLAKDAVGSGATDPDGVLNVALRDVQAEVGHDLVVMATCASTSSPTTGTAASSRRPARWTTTRRWCATARWPWPWPRPGRTWWARPG